jgi:hypothetical protein
MIEVHELAKRYGTAVAVDGLILRRQASGLAPRVEAAYPGPLH